MTPIEIGEWVLVWGGPAFLALGFLFWVGLTAWQLRRERLSRELDRRWGTPTDDARAYLLVEALGDELGMEREPSETRSDYAIRVGAEWRRLRGVPRV
jgi:hypothetical protein